MSDSTADLLISLELHLLDPQVRRDPGEVDALLGDTFVEFGSSGRTYTKDEILVALGAEIPRAIVAVDFATRELAPGVVLLTYSTIEGGLEARRSSIWVADLGRWQMVFHQGTKMLAD